MIEMLLQESLKGIKACNILDVGPGYSNFGRIAAKETGATSITYLDCDSKVLRWQETECKKTQVDAKTRQAILDRPALSTLNGPFDIILCQEVLEHLIDAEDILKALTELLADNGVMVITVPTARSERWLKLINSNYMKNEPFGHVRQFTASALTDMLTSAGLRPVTFIPTQPHYFIAHTWLYGSRLEVEGSTGKITNTGIRYRIFNALCGYGKRFFLTTGHRFWGSILPRNYFVVAVRGGDEHTP